MYCRTALCEVVVLKDKNFQLLRLLKYESQNCASQNKLCAFFQDLIKCARFSSLITRSSSKLGTVGRSTLFFREKSNFLQTVSRLIYQAARLGNLDLISQHDLGIKLKPVFQTELIG